MSGQVGLQYCYHSLKKWEELPLGIDVKILKLLRLTEEFFCRTIFYIYRIVSRAIFCWTQKKNEF